MFSMHRLIGGLVLLSLSACDTLPASGPYQGEISGGATVKAVSDEPVAKSAKLRYALVDVTEPVAEELAKRQLFDAEAWSWPKDTESPFLTVSVGDTVAITLYESQSGGLFVPSEAGVRPGNFVNLPPQTIDKTGQISIPYAGQIKVVGRTLDDISQEISEKLGYRAIEPQAVVSITARRGAEVSVIGEVGDPTRYTLSLGGERILDAIARAGGPRFPGHEMLVTLQRGGKEWTVPFDLLVTDPEKNIPLKPEDTIYAFRDPLFYQAFGASGFRGGYTFPKRTLTVSEAIGQAGGLDDGRADPAEVYLFRHENLDDLSKAGLSFDFGEETPPEETLPVVFKLNLRKADGFFLAQKFHVRDEDIIYIGNAESVEFTKFLGVTGLTSATKITTQNAIQQ